jgi:hypothetical protein
MNAQHFFATPIRLAWHIHQRNQCTSLASLIRLDSLAHSGCESPAFINPQLATSRAGKAVLRVRDNGQIPDTFLLKQRIRDQNRSRETLRRRDVAGERVKPDATSACERG